MGQVKKVVNVKLKEKRWISVSYTESKRHGFIKFSETQMIEAVDVVDPGDAETEFTVKLFESKNGNGDPVFSVFVEEAISGTRDPIEEPKSLCCLLYTS